MLISRQEILELESRMLHKMERFEEQQQLCFSKLDSQKNYQRKALSILYKKISKIENILEFDLSKINDFFFEFESMKLLNHNMFALFKSFIQEETKKTDFIAQDTKDEVLKMSDSFFDVVGKYKKLEKNIVSLDNQIESIRNEVSKLTRIAGKIKESDYDLAGFAKEIRKDDKERLLLIMDNDKLKKKLGKLTRKYDECSKKNID